MNKYTMEYSYSDLLKLAADEAGNLVKVAQRTGISRRRLGKIKAGSIPTMTEVKVLQLLIDRKLT